MSDTPSFPEGSLAKLLNMPFTSYGRMGETAQAETYLHVSDLLKNKKDNRFCIREAVLRHFERPYRPKGTVPAKMRLLWDTGNLIGDEIVLRRLIEESLEYRHLVWGDWQCVNCGHVEVEFGYRPPRGSEDTPRGSCSECGCWTFRYKEVDLREKTVNLVGHPDLLLRLEDGTIVIYEIKTINRTDIPWDSINRPLGDHHMQASYYYYLLKREGYKVSRRIRFLYVDRSLDDMYREKPYKELVEDVLPVSRIQPGIDTCRKTQEHITARTLPDRICESCKDTRTNKCTVVSSCFGRRLNTI